MRSTFLRRLLVCAAAAAVLAPAAGATIEVRRPDVTWLRGDGNYTKASRTWRSIDCIVVHSTEGPFWPSIRWLKNQHSHGSAHFIVSRNGKIVQIVHRSDIAWHSGNARINRESIGIEHEGVSDDPAGFTLQEYRSSARLAAWIARRTLMPIDRVHFVGHAQVPDPFHAGAFGGSDHHTDPGSYWKWDLYLRLVRRYAFPVGPLTVRSAAPLTARGFVPWRASTTGPRPGRVEFRVDGRLLWRDHRAPFAFGGKQGLNTAALRNGRHVLEVRAIAGKQVAVSRRFLRILNHDFELTTRGLRPGQHLTGVVRVRLGARGGHALRVSLLVDGKRVSRDTLRPFSLFWDTRRTVDGRHTVDLVSRALDGRSAHRRLVVFVANHPRPKPRPAPKPVPAPPAPAILGQSVADGQQLTGVVAWQVQAQNAARVDFLVDGALRGSAAAPYALSWDTAAETPGEHVLVARAVAADGRVAEARATVSVATSPPAP